MVRHYPALIVGVLIALYWGRVLQLLRKARRKVGRFANLIPGEIVGQITRIVWIPMIGLWIVLPILGGFGIEGNWLMTPLFNAPIAQWIAVAVAAIAWALTLECWRKMGKSWRIGIDPDEKTKLIVTGAYAYLRHPIYALSSVLMLATAAAWPTPSLIAIAIVHLIFLQFEARREEMHLIRMHGEIYADYCRKTRGFFPKMTSTKAPD
jgi:protein-S-isoprenylcysteine O-methyltransferase Ste14